MNLEVSWGFWWCNRKLFEVRLKGGGSNAGRSDLKGCNLEVLYWHWGFHMPLEMERCENTFRVPSDIKEKEFFDKSIKSFLLL